MGWGALISRSYHVCIYRDETYKGLFCDVYFLEIQSLLKVLFLVIWVAFVLLPHSFAHALTALLSVCVQNFVAVIRFHNVNYFLALQWSHMNILSFQITGNSTVCLTVWSRWQQRKHSGPLLALCEGKPWVTSGFHTQKASNAGNVSMPRYHDNSDMIHMIEFAGKHDFKQIWRQIF